MKAIALITADWHLKRGDRIWPGRPEILGDATYGVQQIVEAATMHEIPILLLGDVFEVPTQRSDAIELARRAMAMCQERELPVYFTQGQHELSAPPLLSALHEWPTYVDGVTFPLGPFLVYGLDYQRPHIVEGRLREIGSSVDILATHQVWRDYMGEERGDAWMHWVPPNVQMILTGDYHVHNTMMFGTDDSPPRKAVSPGPLCMQKINEEPAKGYYLLYEDGSVMSQSLRSRMYHYENIRTEEELQRFEAATAVPAQPGVPPEIETPLLRVDFNGDLDAAHDRIRQAAGDRAHLFLFPKTVELPEVSVEAERRIEALQAGGFEGVLAEFYGDRPELLQPALRLWRAQDREAELADIFRGLVAEATTNDESNAVPAG